MSIKLGLTGLAVWGRGQVSGGGTFLFKNRKKELMGCAKADMIQ